MPFASGQPPPPPSSKPRTYAPPKIAPSSSSELALSLSKGQALRRIARSDFHRLVLHQPISVHSPICSQRLRAARDPLDHEPGAFLRQRLARHLLIGQAPPLAAEAEASLSPALARVSAAGLREGAYAAASAAWTGSGKPGPGRKRTGWSTRAAHPRLPPTARQTSSLRPETSDS